MANNDPRFLSPMGSRLAELGLDVKDVNVGRYIQIDLSNPRPEPEEFAEFGEFDTFTVLNPHDIPKGVWLYLNNKRPESRLPLHYVSRLETVADRFYLQHDDYWDGVTLHIILGGDLRALSVEPASKGGVTIEGTIDVSDRPERKLGSVSVPGVATELTLEEARALLESLDDKDFATQTTLVAVLEKLDNLEVQLKGSLPPSMMELAVNDWDDLPDPSEVPVGATAQLIGTFDVRQNTGAEWVEVVL